METLKRDWSAPALATYGDVEAITAAEKDKNIDGDDGFTLDGQSIGC